MDDQSPANDAVVEPQGRLALASFRNNIVNVIPAQRRRLLLHHGDRSSGSLATSRRSAWPRRDHTALGSSTSAFPQPPTKHLAPSSRQVPTRRTLLLIHTRWSASVLAAQKYFQAPTMPRRKKATAKHVLPSSPLLARQQTPDATTKRLLGYQLTDKEPSYSLGMQGIYHLGTVAGDTPATPGKCKGGCLLSQKAKGRPLRLRSVEAFLRTLGFSCVCSP
ncbi:hypothetical protein V8E54_005634 [Elaphomyces granulatus]